MRLPAIPSSLRFTKTESAKKGAKHPLLWGRAQLRLEALETRITPVVTNIDTGEMFATIQAAIDDTNTVAGNTISADAGLCAEDVTVNKAITLQGATGIAADVVVDPPGGVAIRVTVDGVTIQDLRTTGA